MLAPCRPRSRFGAPACNVTNTIPNEATAFDCTNCHAFVRIKGKRLEADVRESANNSPLAKMLVLLIGAIFLIWLVTSITSR